MKKLNIIPAVFLCTASALAINVVWLNTGNIFKGINHSLVESIAYKADDTSTLVMALTDGSKKEFATVDIESVTFGESENLVGISLDDKGTTIHNPLAFNGVETKIEDGNIVIESPSTESLSVDINGSYTLGGVIIYSGGKVTVTLSDTYISNPNGAAINLQVSEKATLELNGSNTLIDGETYNTPDDEKEKGTVYSTKGLNIKGKGLLNITGNNKHAIVCEKTLSFKNGNVNVLSAASDGLHGDGVEFSGGTYTCVNTLGDGIDADKGDITISGGTIDITVSTSDTKGMKCDGAISIEDGKINLSTDADAVKCIKSGTDFTMTGGTIVSNTTGKAILENSDPSYCSTIKVGGNLSITSGNISITATGSGSKGISVDGDATFSGGKYEIICGGDGVVYTDINNNKDTYSSTCITIDGNATITGGTFTMSNSGSAGKCIKVDGELVMGTAEGNGPDITATTSGKRINENTGAVSIVAKAPGGGRPGEGGGWGPGGGGFDKNADYANPKVIKAQGVVTVNGGKYTLKSTNDGGEGLESKVKVTINGGTLDIATIDDGINAANAIEINGVTVRSISSGNDGIDSNGTITINGGTVIAIGANTPECGLDCDNNTFAIKGGTVFALGGDNSSPRASTQCVVSYRKSIAAGSTITIADEDNKNIITFTRPAGVSTGSAMLISSSSLKAGANYTIYTGGSVSGGTTEFDLTTDGSYTPGTRATTFTGSNTLVSK